LDRRRVVGNMVEITIDAEAILDKLDRRAGINRDLFLLIDRTA
jgi:hypothetical protein